MNFQDRYSNTILLRFIARAASFPSFLSGAAPAKLVCVVVRYKRDHSEIARRIYGSLVLTSYRDEPYTEKVKYA